jgi:4-phosphopantoate--beta-alanine ligase
VNLFHRTEERINKIIALLKSSGCENVLGDKPDRLIPGLSHDRAKASLEGIYSADVVFVPLEDGDRCEALIKMGKKVIAVDLNPLSRTARTATITIIDNIVRVMPNMVAMAGEMKDSMPMELQEIREEFHNEDALSLALKDMMEYVKKYQ